MLDPKLKELTLDGNFQAKVQATLENLIQRGESPKIYEAMRTVEQQREKVRKGYSKTMKSYHLKRGKDNLGLAADIADSKKGWNASKRFWFLLAANCESRMIGWGGLFGLNGKQKKAVLSTIAMLRSLGWPEEHDVYQTAIGWDPAHVQKESNW